ncbi:outer membrane protein assembly factor BamB [Paenibacillus harenae]|uniref:Outer membrane protein assembly factor BamB n=2 Tax=Paenibacillus harenae TaxID=306543 RepID=A0ABT9TZM4_PAEHA|nr:outer membrane protein assembly factor BamB [Paenibacillus harenae]
MHFPRQIKRFRIVLVISLAAALNSMIGCDTNVQPVATQMPTSAAEPTLMSTTIPLQLETVDGQVTLSSLAPIFAGEADISSIPLEASYYGKAGDVFKVSERRGEWIAFSTEEAGLVWLPIWYGSDAAKDIQVSEPSLLKIKPGSRFALFPGSTLTADGIHLGKSIYSAIRWKDWYGVLQSPVRPYGDHHVNRPVLLWLSAADIEQNETVHGGILDPGTSLPINEAVSIIESTMSKGTGVTEVRQLLGEPHFIETSRNLSQTDQTMRLGVTWRYELGVVHFTITFNEERKVEEWHLIQAARLAEQAEVGAYSYPYEYVHEYRVLPPSPTRAVDWTWRNEYNLGHTYLQAVTDRILLLIGDDGGFSGMHDNAGLYAVDRETGETLWRIDAGFGGFDAYMDSNREYANVFIDYDPAAKKYVKRVSRIRLSDGKPVWTLDGTKIGESFRVARAQNTLILYTGQSETNSEGKLIALNAITGKQRWSKPIKNNYEIISDGERYATIMIVQNNKLQALDPLTGKLLWETESEGTQSETPSLYSRPFIEPPGNPFEPEKLEKWIMLGNELLLMDISTKSKQVKARYTISSHELVFALDLRYLLIQQPIDGDGHADPKQYKTALYDTASGKTLWTIPGKGAGAVFDGDTVYMTVNNIPTAVNKSDGRIRWQTEASTLDTTASYYGSGIIIPLDDKLLLSYDKDLLVLDKQTGKQMNRIHDVMFGYPELRLRNIMNGLMNREGNDLYIGSSNGYFSKMKLDF